MTDILTPAQIRARGLAADLQRRALSLLCRVPSTSPELRKRVLDAAGVTISSPSLFNAVEVARLAVQLDAMPGPDTFRALGQLTAHKTADLGYTLDSVIRAQRDEEAERRKRSVALRAGHLARLFNAERIRRATVAYVADSFSVFETLPVRPGKDFDAVLAEVAHGSGLVVVAAGYRLLGADGQPVGLVVGDADLGPGRSRRELETAAADEHNDFADVLELIHALLLTANLGTEGADALLSEGAELGVDLDNTGSADDPDLSSDDFLRREFRRAVELRRQIGPAREARVAADREVAERLQREERRRRAIRRVEEARATRDRERRRDADLWLIGREMNDDLPEMDDDGLGR